tara:strand:+ start:493 stop:693 length:201 start_codon:yes stop_codon:yes gene_type:complete
MLTNPAPAIYQQVNSDIEKLPKTNKQEKTGLLSKKQTAQNGGDTMSPKSRVAIYTKAVRDARSEIA